MFRFNCDYLEGAHPQILERLLKTNYDQTTPYGFDDISLGAKEKIKAACGCPDGEVFFLAGGTQSNYTVLDSLLKNYQGVIAADTGHISVHEAGAIEYSGHKVITVGAMQDKVNKGKLSADSVKSYLKAFYADATYTHMSIPGAVYISHPSEYGTLYTKDELSALRSVCDEYGLKLYLDGARLAYGLYSPKTDVSLEDIARYCDAFCIGGTKAGALIGEAVVFPKKENAQFFFTQIKQHGALLAKGRLTGIQFDELFTNGLYQKGAEHANALAMKIKEALIERGYEQFVDSYTNQQFFILPNSRIKELSGDFVFDDWGAADSEHTVVRIATSWATPEIQVDKLIKLI